MKQRKTDRAGLTKMKTVHNSRYKTLQANQSSPNTAKENSPEKCDCTEYVVTDITKREKHDHERENKKGRARDNTMIRNVFN